MDELLASLFAAAIQYSGLSALDGRPPIQAMPYPAMLREVCADLKADIPALRSEYDECTREHRMLPSECDGIQSEMHRYDRCTHQHGLMAAYIIEQKRIVYRNELDLDNDADNSFIVHEFVHALQRQHYGDKIFATCQSVLEAERQAYAAQQKYLDARGQLLRVGERLRFVTCHDVF